MTLSGRFTVQTAGMYLIELARTIQEEKERRIKESGHRYRLQWLLHEPTAQPNQSTPSTHAVASSGAAITTPQRAQAALDPRRPVRPRQPCGPTPSTGRAVR